MNTAGAPGALRVAWVHGHREGVAAKRSGRASEALQSGSSLLGVRVDIQPQVPLSVDLLLEELSRAVVSGRVTVMMTSGRCLPSEPSRSGGAAP